MDKLAAITFEGRNRSDAVLPYLDQEARRRDKYEYESLPESFAEQAQAINGSIDRLGIDLGLDLSSRTYPIDYVHMYSSLDYYLLPHTPGDTEASVIDNRISIKLRPDDAANTLHSYGHELIHLKSHRSYHLDITPRSDGGNNVDLQRRRVGYTNLRHETFRTINELITEATHFDLIRNYWPNDEVLNDFSAADYKNIGYKEGLIALDAILSQTSDPLATFKDLQIGMFTGEMGRLRVLTEEIGTDQLRRLAKVETSDFLKNDFVEHISARGIANKIHAVKADAIFPWL